MKEQRYLQQLISSPAVKHTSNLGLLPTGIAFDWAKGDTVL